MKPLIVILSGYNSNHGRDTTDRLANYLIELGYQVYFPDYAGGGGNLLTGLYKTKSKRTQADARVIYRAIEGILIQGQQAIVVSHSHGATVASHLHDLDKNINKLLIHYILINGCLTLGHKFTGPVTNYFCPSDRVLQIGAVARSTWSHFKCRVKLLTGRKCTGSRWGNYGQHPDTVNDVNNINQHDGDIPSIGHSTFFADEERGYWFPDLRQVIDEISRALASG